MVYVKKIHEINVNDIKFSEPKSNSKGGQSIWLSHNGEKIIIQIPKSKTPFGLNHQQYEDGSSKFDVSVSLTSPEFKFWIETLDKYICKRATEYSQEWFGKRKSNEVIEEMYKPIKTVPKKDNYSPTMKLKLPYYNGEHKSSVFDDKRNPITPEAITKGCEVMLIVQLSNMWFVRKQFGVTWQVLQAKIYPKLSLPVYAFSDDDEESE